MFKVSVMLNISSLLVCHHSVQFTTIKNIKYWKKHVSLLSKVGEQNVSEEKGALFRICCMNIGRGKMFLDETAQVVKVALANQQRMSSDHTSALCGA